MLMKIFSSILMAAATCVMSVGSMAQTAMPATQSYPTRPIRLIVGFAPGSGADALARLYAQRLTEALGQSVYVENKAGAGQINAIRSLEMAKPDGYTLYLGTGSALSQGPGIRKDLPYDPLKAFTFVAHMGTVGGMVYVNADVPIKTIADLIAYAKANPGKLSYASAGVGSAGHLSAEFFMNRTGSKLFHVPFRSDPEAAREVAAGSVQMAFTLASAMGPLAEANKVRPLMALDVKRFTYFPDVSSAAEPGYKGLENIGPFTYYGLVGPKNLPTPVVEKLNRTVNQITIQPDTLLKLHNAFIEPSLVDPLTFQSFVETEIAKWRKVGSSVAIEF